VKIHPRKNNQRFLNGQQILDKQLYPFKIVIFGLFDERFSKCG
jgi:hypothetical protein